MGDIEAFDPSQAALDWLRATTKWKRLPEKAQQQEWFLGVHKESSLIKEQQKLNQTENIRAM